MGKRDQQTLRVAELDDAIHITKGVAPTPLSLEFQNLTDKALTTLMKKDSYTTYYKLRE